MLELGVLQEPIAPLGWLEGDQHLPERAIERDLPGIGFDDARQAGAVTPVHDYGLVALQHRETTILASELGDLRHLLADRLGREPVAAQHVGRDPFAFLGKPDQEVLGPDIGMAEVARGRKSAGERVLDPRRDADLGRVFVVTVAPAVLAALARRPARRAPQRRCR